MTVYTKILTPPHRLSDSDYEQVISHLSEKENHIFALSEKAKLLMTQGNFVDASIFWEKAAKVAPEEHYFIQQQTLCTYKSKLPSKESSLLSALQIISPIYNACETNDPETLGLVGAIYKRLYESNHDIETLQSAIRAYERGYIVSTNYYTGENFASCLDMLADVTTDSDEAAYCRYEAKKTRKQIIDSLSKKLLIDSEYQDKKWMYATLANCHYHLGGISEGNDYESKFLAENPEQWEQETYYQHKPDVTNKSA